MSQRDLIKQVAAHSEGIEMIPEYDALVFAFIAFVLGMVAFAVVQGILRTISGPESEDDKNEIKRLGGELAQSRASEEKAIYRSDFLSLELQDAKGRLAAVSGARESEGENAKRLVASERKANTALKAERDAAVAERTDLIKQLKKQKAPLSKHIAQNSAKYLAIEGKATKSQWNALAKKVNTALKNDEYKGWATPPVRITMRSK